MVGILELLAPKNLIASADTNVVADDTNYVAESKMGKRYKVKHAHTMSTQNQEHIKNGVGSFGVTSKLKDINKKIKKKASEKEDISHMDPEHVHFQKLEYFQKLQDSLPDLRKQLQNPGLSPFEKTQLMERIRSIEMRDEENDYLLKTMHVIKMMSGGDFGLTSSVSDDSVGDTGELVGLVSETKESAVKQKLSAMYIEAVDPRISHNMQDKDFDKLRVDDGMCRVCQGTELDYDNGELFCMLCGMSQNIRDMNHVSFKESSSKNLISNPTYKRINHFNEWLNSVTNKSSSVVPDSIIHAITLEMQKDHLSDFSDLDKKRVRLYLKRLGQSKYYDSVSAIICKISGQSSLEMPEELLSQLRDMFVQIQDPFEISKPKYRSSFLSYSYTINRMLKLLAYDEYMYAFPLLKSREKLLVQDMIWKGICEILNWRFDPTV